MPSAKFDVEMSSFKSGIAAAKSEVKTLDQQMKMLDATMKAEGKSEQALNQQTQTLNSRLAAQKSIANQAEAALKAMSKNGVDASSESYQKMARELLAAQTGMMETQAALNGLGEGAVAAAGGVEQLESGLNGISKKISLDQVRSGITAIDKGLESAAKKAINLGKAIWENITDVARFSDDTATQAMILNMDVEDYQAYKKVFDTVGEITVQEWQKAKLKVQKAMNDPSKEQVDILKALGISTKEWKQMNGQSGPSLVAKNFEEMFWEIGRTLKKKVESGEMTQDLADTYANALFGKGFAQMNPMFELGEDEFTKRVKAQKVASEEAIQKNAELNDKLIQLQSDFDSLKVEVVGGLAPALTDATVAVNGLLTSVLDYLKTPQGKKALEDMGTAVSGLFDDLGKIDPDQVVKGFTGVFNTVVGSVQWLVENKDGVVTAMEGILIGWGALNVTGGILDVVKIVSGIKDLMGAEAAGTAAGAAWGRGFAGAVAKAAPWLISVYTLLNPGSTGDKLGNNTIIDENGNLTAEGKAAGFVQTENGEYVQDRTQIISEAAQKAWDLYRTNQLTAAGLEELRAAVLNDRVYGELLDQFMDFRSANPNWKDIEDIDLTEWLKGLEPPKVPIDPEVPAGASGKIAEDIGTVSVPVVFVPAAGDPTYSKRTPGGQGSIPGHANGIWAVPRDNYLALLHKDERVIPARQVSNRTFNSNLYIENVALNNGQDAEGMAARIVAAQRREISGFGG